MRTSLALALTTLVPLAALWAPAGARAAEPTPESQQIFMEKCSACHTLGGGVRVGPDLKGATTRRPAEVLRRFIKQPSSLLDSDPYFKDLVVKFKGVRMPDLGLTTEQATGMVDLIDICSKQPCEFKPLFKEARMATEADIKQGRDLFLGRVALANGGPACASCHQVRGLGEMITGGRIASDLTHVTGLLTDRGLAEALKNPTAPLQQKVYKGKSLTEDEVYLLRAFFYKANRYMDDPESGVELGLAGGVGAVLLLLLMAGVRRMRRGRDDGNDELGA